MRICFVSKECAGLRGGGIGTYIAEAGKALRANGHEAWLITTLYNDADRDLIAKLPFDRVVVAGEGVAQQDRRRFFHANPHYGYSHLVHLTLQALGETFDYIEFADYEAEGLVPFQEQRLFGTYGKTVMSVVFHSPTWECFGYDKQSHRASLQIRETCNIEEEAIRIAPVINSPSRGLRDEVLTRLKLERDVAIIRYPMELDEKLPVTPVPRKKLSDLEIIYYGRIEPRKGVEELIEAFRELPECKITLIGGDVNYSPYGKSLRDYLQKTAPDNVTFQDPMPRPKLLKRIQSADVCIFPSLLENWPNTCIEAMSAGRVVIGSKHGGMGEMIEDGVSGFHVDGRSSADIVRVFREDLTNSLDRLDEIGTQAAIRMRMLSDQKRYCKDLLARIEQKAVTALPSVDHEAHKVSIIVPFYNDRDTIDATMETVCGQSHRNLEILIVNDGSPLADVDAVLARQAARDDRVRVLNKPNGGLGSARNFAIEHATGEFLLFCDADNLLRPDYAKTGVEVLVRHTNSHVAVPNLRHFDDETGQAGGTYNALPFDRSACLFTNRFGDAGAFFRRSMLIEENLRYDLIPTGYEDWAMWMDLFDRDIQVERIPREMYDYRVRADSMMKVDSLPNHPALVGWLIQHHLPKSTPSERDLLTTIFQHCGQSIARVSQGHPDHLPPQPPAPAEPKPVAATPTPVPVPAPVRTPSVTPHLQTVEPVEPVEPVEQLAPPLRHKVVDEMSRLSRKIPGLNRLMRSTMSLFGGRKQAGQ